MLIYVVYWNLDLVWWKTTWSYSRVTSDFHKWDVLYCKTLSIQIIPNNNLKNSTKLKVFYIPIVFLSFNLNPFKLKGSKFHLNIRMFFTARRIEDWSRLLRQVGYWSSILGDIQKLTQQSPGQLALADPALRGQTISRWSFPTPEVLWFHE